MNLVAVWIESILARRGVKLTVAVAMAKLGDNTTYTMFEVGSMRSLTLGALLKVAHGVRPLNEEELKEMYAMLLKHAEGVRY